MRNLEIFVRNRRFRRAALLISAIGAVAHALPAAAQEVATSQDEEEMDDRSSQGAAVGGDIVVTALKRGTRLQDTPLAISAVTGESLERAGTTSFTQLTSIEFRKAEFIIKHSKF